MLEATSRETLNNTLFDFYTTDDKFIKDAESIAFKLKDKVYPDRVSGVFNGQIDLDLLQDYEIYYLAKVLFINFQGGKPIDPARFFTPIEIEKYEGMSDIDYTREKSNKLIFDNCIQVTNNMWTCGKVSIQQIAKFHNDSLIVYDKQIQRETEKRQTRSGIKERIKIYRNSVRQIRDLMLKGDYFPTAITYNILANGFEKYDYNVEKKQLIIEVDENNEFAILDGMHRSISGIEALRINEKLEQYMQVNIFHLDIQSAQRYILQESKKNEISKDLLSYFDTDKVASKLINDIDNEGSRETNFIKGNMGQDQEAVRLQNKFVAYSTLIKAIEDNFKLDKKDIRKTRQVKEYLKSFFNELISIYKNEFEDVKNSRKNSFITYNNSFYGYVAMAAKLYEVPKWQDLLFESVAKIDFSRKSKTWKTLGMASINITNKQINSVYKIFKDFIKIEEEVAVDGK